jgi:hypothetical protein
MSYNLHFISDENLYHHVKDTVRKYRFSIDLKKFNKNLIDPIKLTFDAKVYKKSLKEIIESEIIRQMDKSNTNHIGYFHENIFKYINGNWIVPDSGFDLINEKEKIFVELKNKHNTMNSSSSQKTYINMQHKILEGADITCMLVEVIAKNSQNIPWKISIDGRQFEHEKIRRVSIDKFYALVTKDELAFSKLCNALPKVIDDVLKDQKESIMQNSVFEELSEISPDILKSLYLLSFKKYDGF